MPKRDSYGRLVGYLDVENQEFVNAWRKRYVLLDDTSLKFYYDTKGFQVLYIILYNLTLLHVARFN